MMKEYTDKYGTVINIGDRIVPDEGRELVIISETSGEVNGLLGRQIADPGMISILTEADLSRQWTVKS